MPTFVMNCWPFKSRNDSGAIPVADNATYSNPAAPFHSESRETNKELNERNEKLEQVANRARDQLIHLERVVSEQLQQIEEKNKEIIRLKEILDSIRPKEKETDKVEAVKASPVSSSHQDAERKAVVYGSALEKSHVAIKKFPKTNEQKKLLREALLENEFLMHLSNQQIEDMVDYMEKNPTDKMVIIKEGDVGDRLYILESGELEVAQGGVTLGTIKARAVFGELAILYNCRRTATVISKIPSQIWMLERRTFQTIMMTSVNNKQNELTETLHRVPLFRGLPSRKLVKIADALEEDEYKEGDYIIRQGTNGRNFYIISSGQVDVTIKDEITGNERFLRTLSKGDYFGEKALRSESGQRTTNIIATSPVVCCMTLDKESFLILIGQLADKDYINTGLIPFGSPRASRTSSVATIEMPRRRIRASFNNLQLSDLEFIGILGIGGFGRVELRRNRNNPEMSFALKRMKKMHILETKQEKHIFSEKTIMRDSDHPFIVQLYKTFKDERYVYMLLEACLGGELWSKLRDDGSFDEDRTRFYSACVLEAVEYLHLRGVIYRDLKPENVLIDHRGYVKLVDFGFAKKLSNGEKTFTFCGTPEYVAPEVVLNKGHDFAVDYWAFGILLYEMLTGNPPFTSSEPMKTYRMILRGIDGIDWPWKVKKPAQNLIRRLCRTNPSERIGNLRGGVNEIKNHRWFAGFDWDGLKTQQLEPPHVPDIVNSVDLRNFDSFDNENEDAQIESSGWDEGF